MDTNDTDQTIVANGINGATGEYLLPPQTEQQTAEKAVAEPQDKEQLNVLRGLFQHRASRISARYSMLT